MNTPAAAPAPRPVLALWIAATIAVLGIIGFAAFGVWQIQRLGWKLALIERTETRVRAAPVAAPGPGRWPSIDQDDYLRVALAGRFLHERETLVQAVTELGGGFWVLTPLETDAGFTVLVNRGFVPAERRAPASRVAAQAGGTVSITGLLRLSEPAGGFLRSNAPAQDRWYSRDVEAIAQARGLADTAPYFVDADATPNPGGFPVGGLTVLRFSNNHLVYALTWFSLALMLAAPSPSCYAKAGLASVRSRSISVQDTANGKNLLLLVQLRWLAVGGQVLTIAVVHWGIGIALPLGPMALVLLFLLALNVTSLLRHHHHGATVSNTELFGALLFDVAALTIQLYLSGGATNPFISLYLLRSRSPPCCSRSGRPGFSWLSPASALSG